MRLKSVILGCVLKLLNRTKLEPLEFDVKLTYHSHSGSRKLKIWLFSWDHFRFCNILDFSTSSLFTFEYFFSWKLKCHGLDQVDHFHFCITRLFNVFIFTFEFFCIVVFLFFCENWNVTVQSSGLSNREPTVALRN